MTTYEMTWKPLIDRVASAILLFATSPILLFTAAAIRLSDGRPVLFQQERVGANGDHFTINKFRTYPVGSANLTSSDAGGLAPTPVGKWLRRLNIDELPQLLNILAGQMSLVGPRPPLPSQRTVVEGRQECGAIRLNPGVTGLAQVNAFDGMSEQQKVAYDCEYSRRVTAAQDLSILVRTLAYLLKPPPTY